MAFAGEAAAQCAPDPATAGETVVCTGTDNDGFTSDADNVDIEVNLGASINVMEPGNDQALAVSVLSDNNSLVNRGAITVDGADTPFGDRSSAVQFSGDGFSLTNEASGSIISQGRFAVEATLLATIAIGTEIVNRGLIEAADDAVRFGAGTLRNSGTIRARPGFDFGGLLPDIFASDGISAFGTFPAGFVPPDGVGIRVVNEAGGLIEGPRGGAILSSGGLVENAGIMQGGTFAVFIQNDRLKAPLGATVINSGTLSRGGDTRGLNAAQPATIIFNQTLPAAQVTNSGDIVSPDTAIFTGRGARIENLSGGRILADTDVTGGDGIAFRGAIRDDFKVEATVSFAFVGSPRDIVSAQGITFNATFDALVTPDGTFPINMVQTPLLTLTTDAPQILPLVDLAATAAAGFVVFERNADGDVLFPSSIDVPTAELGTVTVQSPMASTFSVVDASGNMVFDVPGDVDFTDNIDNAGLLRGDVVLGLGDDFFVQRDGGVLDGVADGGRGVDTVSIEADSAGRTESGDAFTAFESFEKTGAATLIAEDEWVFGPMGTGSVEDGILALNGAVFDLDTLTVRSGATLAGVGTVTGSVIGEAGSTIAPGFSPGELIIGGDLDISGGGLIEIEIDGESAFDSFLVGGDLILGGGFIAFVLGGMFSMDELEGSELGLADFFNLEEMAGGDLAALFGDVVFTLRSGATLFDLAFTSDAFRFDAAAFSIREVPVPAGGLLLLSGLGALAFVRRRRG